MLVIINDPILLLPSFQVRDKQLLFSFWMLVVNGHASRFLNV